MSWILDLLPWWVIPALGGAALIAGFIALRAFGFTARQTWTVIGGGLAAIAAATLYQRGRNAGVQSVRQRQEAADAKAVKTRDEIEDAVAGRTTKQNRSDLWVRAFIPLLILVTLAGCQSMGGSFCKVAKPIYGAESDRENASDKLIAGVNAHNQVGAALCGWKP